jgi:hypothetical protein
MAQRTISEHDISEAILELDGSYGYDQVFYDEVSGEGAALHLASHAIAALPDTAYLSRIHPDGSTEITGFDSDAEASAGFDAFIASFPADAD